MRGIALGHLALNFFCVGNMKILKLFIFIIIILNQSYCFCKDKELYVTLDLKKELIEAKQIELVIYYVPLNVFSTFGRSVDLIKLHYSYKIQADDIMITKYLDEHLKKINNFKLIRDASNSFYHIVAHCEILSDKRLIFSFSLGNVMLVNGIRVKPNKLFYHMIKDFIPSCELKGYQVFIDGIEYSD